MKPPRCALKRRCAPSPNKSPIGPANQRAAVHAAIRDILTNPSLGEEKQGDLAGVRVFKFDCVNQPFLLAYLASETTRTLLAIGPHENFYRDLKC